LLESKTDPKLLMSNPPRLKTNQIRLKRVKQK